MDRYDYTLNAQGSTRNKTNLPGQSDLDFTISIPVDPLLPHSARYDQWQDLRDTVRRAMLARFGADVVEQAKKCINIDGSELAPIDLVPCLSRPFAIGKTSLNGIEFWTSTQPPRHIISHPDIRAINSEARDAAASGAYRRLARTLKAGRIATAFPKEQAPSYMLESSAYAVPSELMSGEPSHDMAAYIQYMQSVVAAPTPQLMNLSGTSPLIGLDADTQWSPSNARAYIDHASQYVK